MTIARSKGPVVLVTGATDGIGKETAGELLRRGASVIVHGRNPARLEATFRELQSAHGSRVLEPLRADFSSLAEVRAMASELERRGTKPEVLLNNAGVFMKREEKSADGFECTMAVNHLAPFLLTHEILASRAGGELRRIINVSSVAHGRGNIELDAFQRDALRFSPYGSYATSKLANVLFTVELARRLAPRGVTVNALHPGVVSTKLLTQGFEMEGPDSVADGAATSVMLALDEEVASITGAYFSNRKQASMNPMAKDATATARFYELSAEKVGVAPLPRV